MRGACAAMVVACGLGVAAGPALADSSSIAGAQTVVPGTTYYGNLGQVTPVGGDYYSYWLLPEQAGDSVTIDWQAYNPGGNAQIKVFPSGTTDFNVGQTESLHSSYLNSNNEDQLTFQTTTDGVLPLQFGTCCNSNQAGPYSFSVSITHGMSVLLQPLAASLSGTATANVATPDGSPLSNVYVVLQASTDGNSWTNVGAAASVNGVASIPYTVPSYMADQSIQFQVVATLAGYTTTASGSQTVDLPKEPKQPTSATITTTVTISRPTPGHSGLPPIGAKLSVKWLYSRSSTTIARIRATRLPLAARVTIECLGHGCPTQVARVRGQRVRVPIKVSVSARDLTALTHDLSGARFRPGNRVRFIVSERGHRSTEGTATIRAGQAPDALLR